MTDRVYLSAQEREKVASILAEGLKSKADQWTAARIALARSLQNASAPDPKAFGRQAKQPRGVELHAQQLLGEGRDDDKDHSDVFRALLSAYEGRNLFNDEDAFHNSLQSHVRRGIEEIAREWRPDTDFNQFLLKELFFDRPAGAEVAEGSADPGTGERVSRILGQLGIGATTREVEDGPRLTRFTLELHTIDDSERLRRGLSKIAFALAVEADALGLERAPGDQRVYLTVPRASATWRTVGWNEVRPSLKGAEALEMQLPVCVGTDTMGAAFVFDMAETPHLFIGGTTGSGKSMCLHALLLSMIEGGREPQLVLVDPKAVEFASYAGCQLLRGAPITHADDAVATLNGLVDEMNDRQEILRSLDVRNIAEANERGARLARIVVVIDELGDLLMTRRDIEAPLIRLAQKARFSGIHLVLATQRPEAATFPGLLRSNVPSRIALTVQKSAESRIILDEIGAEALLMRGDMLVRLAGRQTVRAHGCRVDAADISKAVTQR